MAARSERLSGFTTSAKHTRCDLPYFHMFLETLVVAERNFLSTKELHLEYVSYVMKHTDDKNALAIAKEERRFAKTLSVVALQRGFDTVSNPKRGYRLAVKRQSLPRKAPRLERVLVPPKVIRIDSNRGVGCFAADNYETDQIVCRYTGQIITNDEKRQRVRGYESEGTSYKIIDLPDGTFLDGSRDQDGNRLPVEQNPGAAMNNSATSPNCKLVMREGDNGKEYLMVALTGIPSGTECVWWYGDARRGLERWMYE